MITTLSPQRLQDKIKITVLELVKYSIDPVTTSQLAAQTPWAPSSLRAPLKKLVSEGHLTVKKANNGRPYYSFNENT